MEGPEINKHKDILVCNLGLSETCRKPGQKRFCNFSRSKTVTKYQDQTSYYYLKPSTSDINYQLCTPNISGTWFIHSTMFPASHHQSNCESRPWLSSLGRKASGRTGRLSAPGSAGQLHMEMMGCWTKKAMKKIRNHCSSISKIWLHYIMIRYIMLSIKYIYIIII